MSQLRPALILFILLTIVTGAFYPAIVTLVGKVAFSEQAEGSLIVSNGTVVGSSLIGQQFTSPQYFWGRLSATAPTPYNAAASSGSNLAPTNPKLVEAVSARIAELRAAAREATEAVPIDLVTSSGSGLDPHISVAAARFQIERIARARGIPRDDVERIIRARTERRFLGVFGEEHVNVLEMNLALDGVLR